MVDAHPGTASEQEGAALMDAAAALLGQRRDIPAAFIAALFARAVPEDFLSYQAREVAVVAERAWSLVAIRRPGTCKIRLETPPDTIAGDRLKDVSVLEIVNDGMPLLVAPA